MPELPEVETIRRQLEPKLIDAAIVDAGAHWSAKFTPALDAVGTEIVSAVDAASICCSTSTRAPTVDHRGNWSSISG